MPQIPSPLMMPNSPQRQPDPLQQLLMSLIGQAGSTAIAGGLGQLFEPSPEEEAARAGLIAQREAEGRAAGTPPTTEEQTLVGQQTQALADIQADPEFLSMFIEQMPSFRDVVAGNGTPQDLQRAQQAAMQVAPFALESFTERRQKAQIQQTFDLQLGLIQSERAELDANEVPSDDPRREVLQKREMVVNLRKQTAPLVAEGALDPSDVTAMQEQLYTATQTLVNGQSIRRMRMIADPDTDLNQLLAEAEDGSMDALLVLQDIGQAQLATENLLRGSREADVIANAARSFLTNNLEAGNLGVTLGDVENWLRGRPVRAPLQEFFAQRAEEGNLIRDTARANLFGSILDLNQPFQLAMAEVTDAIARGRHEDAVEIYNQRAIPAALKSAADPDMISTFMPLINPNDEQAREDFVDSIKTFTTFGGGAIGFMGGAKLGAAAGAAGGPIGMTGGAIVGGILGATGGRLLPEIVNEAVPENFQLPLIGADRGVMPQAQASVDIALNAIREVNNLGRPRGDAVTVLQEALDELIRDGRPEDQQLIANTEQALQLLR